MYAYRIPSCTQQLLYLQTLHIAISRATVSTVHYHPKTTAAHSKQTGGGGGGGGGGGEQGGGGAAGGGGGWRGRGGDVSTDGWLTTFTSTETSCETAQRRVVLIQYITTSV
eukprot:jgi/Chrzof1/2819/Cz12g00010.t1